MLDAWVLIVDGSGDALHRLTAWIGELPGFRLAGVARSAAETLVQIRRTAPDIVLMDIAIPDGGLDLTRIIKEAPRPPLVVLTTIHESAAVLVAAKAAGADACLTKNDLAWKFPVIAGELWQWRHKPER